MKLTNLLSNFVRRATALLSLATLVVGCTASDTPNTNITSIASLKAIGTSYRTICFSDNTTIEGRVVANDFYDEFYNRIIIDDGSAGAEINIERSDNYLDYPFGSRVEVHCNGLWMSNSNGKISIGGAPTADYTLSDIEEDEIGVYLKCYTDIEEPLTPLPLTISQITSSHLMRYVSLTQVEIINGATDGRYCQVDSLSGRTTTTQHTLCDENGDSITLECLSTCTYARNLTPEGTLDIDIVIDYFDGEQFAIITAYSVRERK